MKPSLRGRAGARAVSAALALLFLPPSPASGQGGPLARPDFSSVREFIREQMPADSVPAMAVAVVRGGEIIWEEGFGAYDAARRARTTEHTPFYLASLTKTLTATAAMVLHERGRLHLDRPANDYLSPARLWSPRWDPAGATVRRLATHTAGLTTYDRYCPEERVAECRIPFEEIVRRYGVVVTPPGEGYDYSNLGYLVLGEVVARAAGRDLNAVMRDEVFGPLGMTRSSIGVRPDLVDQTAIGYFMTVGPQRPLSEVNGASTGYASVHDLALFGLFALKTRRPGQRAILPDSVIDLMQRPAAGTGGRYGLGWWVEEQHGYPTVLAQGGTFESSAWLRLVPSEGIAVAVLANRGTRIPEEVLDRVLSILLPPYAARLASPAPPAGNAAPAPAPVVPAGLVGSWSGLVRTWRGDVPLALEVLESGEVRARLGTQPGIVVNDARLRGVRLTGWMPGDLGLAEEFGAARPDLELELSLRDGSLQGAVTTRPRSRVSFWAELRRR